MYNEWLATVWHAPLFELGVDDSVGEALAADSDALEYTVALQLVQDQFGVHHTWQHIITRCLQARRCLAHVRRRLVDLCQVLTARFVSKYALSPETSAHQVCLSRTNQH